ncbi:MAG TPA: transcriptional repressor [Dehalococcoidia bacterium]|nr:transcriptional repressor [Dehalococcoidia bacterium]
MNSISKKTLASKSERVDNSRAALNLAGTRVTSQRALILEIIRQGEGHLDADEIYRRARQKQPRLSLSTVYRTVQALKKLGLIQELHFDESHHHYEAKPPTKHHHLVCLGCGRVIEFQYPLSRIKRNVAGGGDFEIVDADIRVTGYCPRCRQDRE